MIRVDGEEQTITHDRIEHRWWEEKHVPVKTRWGIDHHRPFIRSLDVSISAKWFLRPLLTSVWIIQRKMCRGRKKRADASAIDRSRRIERREKTEWRRLTHYTACMSNKAELTWATDRHAGLMLRHFHHHLHHDEKKNELRTGSASLRRPCYF